MTERVDPKNAIRIEKKTPNQDRTTATLQIMYEEHGEQGRGFDFRFSHAKDTCGEEPYMRKIKTGSEPAQLDLGWCKNLSLDLLVIENTTGQNLDTNPTEEEKDLIKRSVIYVRCPGSHYDFQVIPGRFMMVQPTNNVIQVYSDLPATGRVVAIPR